MTRNPTQYALDFTSAANERCSVLLGLREAVLPVTMTPAGVDGVIDLLQRLVQFSSYLPSSLADPVRVEAQVIHIATKIHSRTSVQDRTIRRWTSNAVALGLLDVTYQSHLRGGHRWNTYTINFSRVLALINLGRTRPDKAGQDVRPIGRTKCPPLGADKMSAPLNVFKNVSTHVPLPRSSEELPRHVPDELPVVVSDFLFVDSGSDPAYTHVPLSRSSEELPRHVPDELPVSRSSEQLQPLHVPDELTLSRSSEELPRHVPDELPVVAFVDSGAHPSPPPSSEQLHSHAPDELAVGVTRRSQLRIHDPNDMSPERYGALAGQLLDMGMGGSQHAVLRARNRGMSPDEINDLVRRYHETRAHPPPGKQVTIGWLYRWLTGESRPEDTTPSPRGRPPEELAAQRAELERARLEARRAAEADIPLAEQLRRLRDGQGVQS